ncbi:hypothetical protein HG263_10300 [Pseudoalteromonas sp. JBTF-M23]|uniref:Uncharacterized protein n=1 Tax=Pseudoalteromonas caenipelagi TaxID=2726988 RepID=A0A849VGT3_9GAMM|nr:hypothetical protein [Pseudoalteromonas caenipelagi]NOU50921.1 hypothetical protein [Pseudoalteromonas caenipelagi]
MRANLFALLFCLLVTFSVFSSNANERNIRHYIPKSYVHLINSTNKQVACANKVLTRSTYLTKQIITVGHMLNTSSNDAVPNGLTNLFLIALAEITQDSAIQVMTAGFHLNQSLHYQTTPAYDKKIWDHVVTGQTSGFDKGIAGKGRTGGLFSKYFGLGIADLSSQSLLLMDFLLTNKQGIVESTASMAMILEYLDNSTDSEISDKNSGFYFSWSDDVGESITLAQKVISSQAALIFLEKITGLNLKCNKTKHTRAYNEDIEAIEVRYHHTDVPKQSKRFYFPRQYRTTLECSLRKNYHCQFKFKHRLNRDIIVYVEEAFRNAFNDEANVDVSCQEHKGTLSCSAVGELRSFSKSKFRKNLYG